MVGRRKSPLKVKVTQPHLCTLGVRLRLLGGLPFFSHLPAEDLAIVNEKFRQIGYAANDYIYHAGDPAARLFVVAEGMVRLLQTAASGRTVLLDLLAPGEFLGSLAALGTPAYLDTAQAQTPVCLLRIEADDFRLILDQYPQVTLRVLEALNGRWQAANQRVFLLGALDVRQRLAATLLMLGEKLGRKRSVGLLIDAPLSREDLAAMTGTTPETVSRVMHQFQEDGLIASGRLWIAICDTQQLAELAQT